MSTLPITEFAVSVYTSRKPLGKLITRLSDGSVKKESRGQIASGKVEEVVLTSLTDFAILRASLTASQALGYGTTGQSVAKVVTKQALERMSDAHRASLDVPVVARDSSHLHFAAGPGVLMLDHDPAPGDPALSAEDLREALFKAMPELRGVTMLWAPSAGSLIYAGDEQVIGLQGSRLYFVISEACRTREVGALLFDRLVLAGYGRIAISSSGRMLQRGPIDDSVWQPERLDYVRATCGRGLEARPGKTRMFLADGARSPDEQTMLDINSLRPLSPEESGKLDAIWKELFNASQAKAGRVRREWAEARVATEVGEVPLDADVLNARIAKYEASVKSLALEREHPLTLQDGRKVTVGDLRDDPKKYDLARMADPLEPEYGGNDKRIAQAYLMRDGGNDPAIFSHAHGGTWYKLRDSSEDFEGLDDSPPVQEAPQPQRPRFHVHRAADYRAGPPPKWHIRSVLPQGELVVVYGASGSGKSFVVLDMVAAIASGVEWRGLRVTSGRVVYVVGEGRAGFRKRLDALELSRGVDLDALDLGIVDDCPRLLEGDEVALAAAIEAAGGATVVVIDTLAQAMAGGDENTAVDMGKAVAACRLMHEKTGATVLLVHHSGKEPGKGARGWSGLKGAVDAELEVTRKDNTGARCIKVTKQKDGDDFASYPFELEVVNLGVDDDLFDITSCVVRHLDETAVLSFEDGDEPRPKGKWRSRLWDLLTKRSGPMSRDDLIAAMIDLEPAPSKGRDVRKQNAVRAHDEMLAEGWFADGGAAGLVPLR